MLNIVLYEPEIPPNTGNIMRLCANTGCRLHLIEPLGFDLDEKKLRRAGLDYRDFAEVSTYSSLDASFHTKQTASRVFGVSTKGSSHYHQARFQRGDTLLFGPETRGLPAAVLSSLEDAAILRIPMRRDSRSLNLSNAVAVVLFEALRQLDFSSLQ